MFILKYRERETMFYGLDFTKHPPELLVFHSMVNWPRFTKVHLSKSFFNSASKWDPQPIRLVVFGL